MSMLVKYVKLSTPKKKKEGQVFFKGIEGQLLRVIANSTICIDDHSKINSVSSRKKN